MALTGRIDRFTDAIGFAVAWLNVPLVLAVAYDVIARYFFHAPTIWAYDVTYMLYAAIFMLGAAYALHKGAHIRTDFFFESWSTRTKGLIDSIACMACFFRLLFVSLCGCGGHLVLVRPRRDLGADAVAAAAVAVQGDYAVHLPVADYSRRFGGDQESLRRLYGR